MNETVVREWFDRVDSDKSGSITALQLKRALGKGNLEFSLSVVEQMIRGRGFLLPDDVFQQNRIGKPNAHGSPWLISAGEIGGDGNFESMVSACAGIYRSGNMSLSDRVSEEVTAVPQSVRVISGVGSSLGNLVDPVMWISFGTSTMALL
ncbi:hypothetical protein KIW84_050012 [Lathyrus oleraceus]|uniref:EF-hand domain-containing protein n=1 Tax=Pisum sativum TaxID=3888 RepID=A0A9D4WG97_PEA|nr:hypothetical protein KIW84_050012 [Pisum sativum]